GGARLFQPRSDAACLLAGCAQTSVPCVVRDSAAYSVAAAATTWPTREAIHTPNTTRAPPINIFNLSARMMDAKKSGSWDRQPFKIPILPTLLSYCEQPDGSTTIASI